MNLSKANAIRRKALEHAKNREWDKALREFIRLSEIEEHNPNVFNELGDLYLKLGNKAEAFSSFQSAIDAYARVSLYNNAVAVCKKIIRLNPNDHTVYGKLASLRNKQGFRKEAESYAMMFLDKFVQQPQISPEQVRHLAVDLAVEMSHAAGVLDRIADYLVQWEFVQEAGGVLEELVKLYAAAGKMAEREATEQKMKAIGYTPKPPAEKPAAAASKDKATPSTAPANVPPAQEKPSGTGARAVPPASPASKPARRGGDSVHEFGTIELGATASSESSKADVATEVMETPAPEKSAAPEEDETPQAPRKPMAQPESPPDPEEMRRTSDKVWIPKEDLPDELRKNGPGGEGEVVPVSDIVGQFNAEVRANIDVEDYRSHYDLGMAYLEMDLLPEAIREFQFASNSSLYQVRSLEMIGLCFLKQNQPRLAIKQLEKGLHLVGDGDRESLGLQYNLGLAYEMMGDIEKAKAAFEDVYVVDVTFRDVDEKIKKYGAS